ncbi:MAG: calcium/sodium antiporter [Kofleriaceae bacterium]|nr:calcium/sodium antiporter [Kofleriaceae bacterium]MBP9171694.1 calcium/sodium antiporter [Kofleriaceae bacterium]MBP9862202.1 calcium/sodium antiporter [Kofleriaceae bacterium]
MSLETFLALARLGLGLGVLFVGAVWLSRGSETLARTLGVPQLVIGLTVAAYGTSAPELAVSTEAAADHLTPIALGNVIGSCVANISLILGLTALLAPPRIDGYLIRREIPILLGSVIAVPITLADGIITRLEGGILVGCAVVFTIASLAVTGRAIADDDVLTQAPVERGSRIGALVVSGLGVLLLVVGSQLFIGGARAAAGQWGISDRMLGMTLVALGTSLPELMTAVVSSMRGQGAIAIGTLVGSNLLNVFLVLGTVAYLNPVRVGERMHVVDAVGLAVITLLGVAVMRGRRQITRTEGGVLVAAYVGFLVAASAL